MTRPANSAVADGALLRLSVEELTERVASRTPAPGGGAVAAITVALAAGLVAMAARFSDRQLVDSGDLAERADLARGQALPLADRDAAAYQAVLDAYALPRHGDPEERRRQINAALQQAAEVPLDIARIGAEIALLAERVAREGNHNLVGDAVTAALLAEAAVRSAAALVRINVELGELTRELRQQAQHYELVATEAAWKVASAPDRVGATAGDPDPAGTAGASSGTAGAA